MESEPIWVVPYVRRDEVGDPILDEEGQEVLSGDPWFWTDCKIWPRQSTENAAGGIRIIGGQNVWIEGVPRNGDGQILVVDARDTIILRQTEYEVDGEPGFYVERGWKLVLRRVGIDRTAVVTP